MKQSMYEGIIGPMMVFGVFGNLNVIVAVAMKKTLRTKGALLVMILAISHLVCNLSELKILLMRHRLLNLFLTLVHKRELVMAISRRIA
uniref:G-protein coupled receptors family 1 profile domain-containing protein n=1 Tax=Caenorhabditis japonica TaxID=281687 RepID=A0A8R1HTB8_CAEJA